MATSMKRFYQHAAPAKIDDCYQIRLDDKPLSTPDKSPVLINNKEIADIVCHEWNAQGEVVIPDTMPVYGLIVTAIDKTSPDDRASIMDQLTPYIDGDLLFYHAPEPIGLTRHQSTLWGDVIDTFAMRHNIRPKTTHDLIALRQDDTYHTVITAYAEALTAIEFTVFHTLVSLTGSPLLSWAAFETDMDTQDILKIVNAESDFYQAHYNFDPEDISLDERAKAEILARECAACLTVLRLTKI